MQLFNHYFNARAQAHGVACLAMVCFGDVLLRLPSKAQRLLLVLVSGTQAQRGPELDRRGACGGCSLRLGHARLQPADGLSQRREGPSVAAYRILQDPKRTLQTILTLLRTPLQVPVSVGGFLTSKWAPFMRPRHSISSTIFLLEYVSF